MSSSTFDGPGRGAAGRALGPAEGGGLLTGLRAERAGAGALVTEAVAVAAGVGDGEAAGSWVAVPAAAGAEPAPDAGGSFAPVGTGGDRRSIEAAAATPSAPRTAATTRAR